MVRLLSGLALLAVISLPRQGQESNVRASVDSTRYRIGEWIHVKVETEIPAGDQMTGPAEGDSLGLFEVLGVKASEPVIEDNRKRQSFLVRLITFEPGETAIPPMEFRVISDADSSMHQALTDSIPVSITTVEVEAEAELKDIKPPLAAPWAFEDVLPWLILLAIAAILSAAYWYYKKIRKRQLAQPEAAGPPLPAHELALMALRQLEDKRLWQQGKVKDFYSEVTEIIRRVFEARFRIIALELTSDEIMAQLKEIPSAQGVLKLVNTFLLTADLVKFAKYEPSMAEHEEELQTAYSIVRALIPKPEPISVEAPADVR